MSLNDLERILFLCTIINFALMVFWFVLCVGAPDLVYRTQRRWFPISRETFTIVMYCFLGVYKIFFLMFNLVPLVAVLIVNW